MNNPNAQDHPNRAGELPLAPRVTGADEARMRTREWVWLGMTAAGLMVVYLSPLHEHLTHLQVINADIQAFGHWGPIVFILMTAALTSMGFPRMLLYPVGGIAFGFSGGMIWSLAGTLLGAYVTFCYARWAGQGFILAKWPVLHRITGMFENNGTFTIALLRQMPSPGFFTNLLLGISPVTHRAFLAGTAIGSIPSAIPATLIGSSAIQLSAHSRMWYVVASMICLVLLWALFGLFIRFSPRYRSIRSV